MASDDTKNPESAHSNDDAIVMVATAKGMWPFVAASLLMVAGCLAIAIGEFARFNVFERGVGWFGVFFFGYGLIVATKRALGLGLPVISMTPEGFHATQVTKRPVPWSEIVKVGKWSFSGSDVLVVKVTEPAMRMTGLTWMARLTLIPNRFLGIDGLAIALTGMPTTASQFVKIVKSYRWKMLSRVGKLKGSSLSEHGGSAE